MNIRRSYSVRSLGATLLASALLLGGASGALAETEDVLVNANSADNVCSIDVTSGASEVEIEWVGNQWEHDEYDAGEIKSKIYATGSPDNRDCTITIGVSAFMDGSTQLLPYTALEYSAAGTWTTLDGFTRGFPVVPLAGQPLSAFLQVVVDDDVAPFAPAGTYTSTLTITLDPADIP